MRVTALISRVLPSFGLVYQSRCSRRLITSLLLVVSGLTARHLGYIARLHALVGGDYVLEAHHVLLHVGLRLWGRLVVHDTRVVLGLLGHVGVAGHPDISHVF